MLSFENKHGLIQVSPTGAGLLSWQTMTKTGLRELLYHPAASDEADYPNVIVGPRAGRYLTDGVIELHGGPDGYSRQPFLLSLLNDGIRADYRDERNDVRVSVAYRLKPDGLTIELRAVPSRPMHLNLTSHLYFNLGELNNRDLKLWIGASAMVKKENQLPTGYDKIPEEKAFHTAKPLGRRVIDDCYLLDPSPGENASLTVKGQSLTVSLQTDQPALVVYTYDHPATPANRRRAIALEAQAPPGITSFDPARAEWYSPARPYCRTIIWRVSP